MKALLLTFLTLAVFVVAAEAQNPGWQWGQALMGWNGKIYGTATDSTGNTYVAGYFEGSLTLGQISISSQRRSLIVAKQDTQGNWLWARKNTYVGTAVNLSYCTSVAVDNQGAVYVGGSFYGPLILGSTTLGSLGYYDLFAAKLDASGNWLWAKAPEASTEDWSYVYSIALDPASNLYITGAYSGIIQLGGASFTSDPDCEELVLAKLDTNGNWLWERTIDASGPQDYSRGYAVAADAAQNVYVAGYFDDSITLGAHTLVCDGFRDMFVARLDNSGVWSWARLGDLSEVSATDYRLDMVCDGLGNAYLCGPYDYDLNLGDIALSGTWGGNFIVKLDSSGNWLWAHQLGDGEYHEWSIDVVLDSQNCPYVTSYCTGTVNLGGWTHTTLPDWNDLIVAKLDPLGYWLWVQTANDASDEGGTHISLDSLGNVYVLGTFWGTLELGDDQFVSYDYDYFIAKLVPPAGEALPLSPQNVSIAAAGINLVLQWDPVSSDTQGQALTPDYYRVYYSYTDCQSGFYLLAQTTGTSYTHTGAALSPLGFYKVSAFLNE